MIRKFLIALAILQVFSEVSALTIDECYKAMEANYPLAKQRGLIDRAEKYTIENISKAWLPGVELSAEASWQTETTKLPIDFNKMGIHNIDVPSMAKDRYGVTLNITQTLWDGGSTSASKNRAHAESEVSRQRHAVGMYEAKARVNNLYFGILLNDEMLRVSSLMQENLSIIRSRLEAGMTSGVANQSDVNAVAVEQAKAKQQRVQYINSRKAYIEMLSLLTEIHISDSTEFEMPTVMCAVNNVNNRPEMRLFDSRIIADKTQLASIKSMTMPKFGAFATAGYGRPGLDMFENKFSPYAMVGVKAVWNIGAFYTKSNHKHLVEIDINSIENERETFLTNAGIEIADADRAIQSQQEQMKYDDEIVTLHESIVKADEVKLEQGVITGSDFMRDVNELHLSRQTKALHNIQYLNSLYNKLQLTNGYE